VWFHQLHWFQVAATSLTVVTTGSLPTTMRAGTLHVAVREETFALGTVKLFNGFRVDTIFLVKI
jgi:hypothetical protein